MNKKQWLKENGFNSDEITYCITGDTYKNKEYLKQQGCKYSSLLKWHNENKISLPKDCRIIAIRFNDIYKWNETLNKPLLFKDASNTISRALSPIKYEFLGTIGQRIYNILVKYKYSSNFISRFGQFTYIHTFETENNKIIWFTTKNLELNVNTKVLMTGTIVQHQNYKGDNTTVVNRCIIKESK